MYLLFENVANVLQDRNKDVKIKLLWSTRHQTFVLKFVICFPLQATAVKLKDWDSFGLKKDKSNYCFCLIIKADDMYRYSW